MREQKKAASSGLFDGLPAALEIELRAEGDGFFVVGLDRVHRDRRVEIRLDIVQQEASVRRG